jgi:hypothetical protein
LALVGSSGLQTLAPFELTQITNPTRPASRGTSNTTETEFPAANPADAIDILEEAPATEESLPELKQLKDLLVQDVRRAPILEIEGWNFGKGTVHSLLLESRERAMSLNASALHSSLLRADFSAVSRGGLYNVSLKGAAGPSLRVLLLVDARVVSSSALLRGTAEVGTRTFAKVEASNVPMGLNVWCHFGGAIYTVANLIAGSSSKSSFHECEMPLGAAAGQLA